jgi:hypothetical protein
LTDVWRAILGHGGTGKTKTFPGMADSNVVSCPDMSTAFTDIVMSNDAAIADIDCELLGKLDNFVAITLEPLYAHSKRESAFWMCAASGVQETYQTSR